MKKLPSQDKDVLRFTDKNGTEYALNKKTAQLIVTGYETNLLADEHKVLKHLGERWDNKKLNPEVLKTLTHDVLSQIKGADDHLKTRYKILDTEGNDISNKYGESGMSYRQNEALLKSIKRKENIIDTTLSFTGAALMAIPVVGPWIGGAVIGGSFVNITSREPDLGYDKLKSSKYSKLMYKSEK